MLARRITTGFLLVAAILWIGSVQASEQKLLPEIEPNDEGLYIQPWFMDSFLDLREDIAESAAEGKHLAIIWEQRGCPYCAEMHNVNLRIPAVVDYIRDNFNVIQLNLWGDREVTDLDGEVTTEKQLARKYRVQFTPTIQFLPATITDSDTKPGHDAEVWRLLGYWKPFHFKNSFVYVRTKGYETQPNFQRWLQALAEEMEARGEEVRLW